MPLFWVVNSKIKISIRHFREWGTLQLIFQKILIVFWNTQGISHERKCAARAEPCVNPKLLNAKIYKLTGVPVANISFKDINKLHEYFR